MSLASKMLLYISFYCKKVQVDMHTAFKIGNAAPGIKPQNISYWTSLLKKSGGEGGMIIS